jgi:hypothetical protein
MIRALRLGNFKAFGETQEIPIRPLTLIYGPNSAGKSSIIHALALLHQVSRNHDFDVGQTEVGGRSIDLGGFLQYVHRRDPSRRVEIGISVETNSLDREVRQYLEATEVLDVTVSIGIAVDDVGEPAPDDIPHVVAVELSALGSPFLRMSERSVVQSRQSPRKAEDFLRLDVLDYTHPVVASLLTTLVESATTATKVCEEDLQAAREAASGLLSLLRTDQGRFLPLGVYLPGPDGTRDWQTPRIQPVRKACRKEDLVEAVRLFLPRILAGMFRAVDRSFEQSMTPFDYLGPLRSYPPRHIAFTETDDPNWKAGGGFAWTAVLRDEALRQEVNRWLGGAFMQTPYELRKLRYFSAGEVVRIIDRAVEDLHKSYSDMDRVVLRGLGREGEDAESSLPDDRERWTPDQWEVGLTNLESLVLDCEESLRDAITGADSKATRPRSSELEELVLFDRRTGTVVSHRDVGIGVSQVLPVLVHAYAPVQGRLTAIEQPEIHLHPALQAELADVFIEAAFVDPEEPGPANTYVLETHSEHLILRVLRRIRETAEGSLPADKTPIHPSDVAVLYVEPDKNGSRVIEIPITEDGEFGRPWPQGFFAERVRELM